MNDEGKKLKVSAIKEGTVIDHIPSNSLFDVVSILNLDSTSNQVTFGYNLESHKLGSKAIIKIWDMYLDKQDIDRIALIAPEAKISIIKNYEVTQKMVVELTDEINGIVQCFNPKCITNHEDITTSFKVFDKKNLELKCFYCERITDRENLKII